MKKTRLPNFGTVLLGMAALVNLARWVGVFTIAEDAPTWVQAGIPFLGALSGLVTGLVIAGGLAFVAHRLGGLQPFTPKGRPVMRFWGAAISGLGILGMSAFLLPPYVRMTMPTELSAQIGDVNAWSVMAVLVGDLIIVAIALADAKSAGFTSQSVAGAMKSDETAKPGSKSAKKSDARSSKYPRKCLHCDTMIVTSNAVGGHMKKHHPELCKPKAMAVGLFEQAVKKAEKTG